jgi:hypothetical protein
MRIAQQALHVGGLSVVAIMEYLHLWDRLEAIQLQPEQDDVVR